jgi:TATA-box binding protein (TBP) (component of TFIID and TFIIIB)
MFPKLVNVVANFSLNCVFDLNNLKTKLNVSNVSYNPQKFRALIIRSAKPKATILLFANGSVTVTGSESEIVSKVASFWLAGLMTKLNYEVTVTGYKIVNMVATYDVSEMATKNKETRLNLVKLRELNLIGALYEPEIFPAYSCSFNGVKLIVFNSGKINFTGGKSMFQIMEAFESFISVLFKYKMLK